jgi:hypothetical protein
MNVRRIGLASLLATICVLLSAAAPAWAEDVIAQFEGSGPGNAGGHMVTMVGLKILVNKKTMAFAIPNDEPKKGETAKPKKELDDAVKKLTKGQYVKAGVATSSLGPTLVSIEAYDAKPGEDTENGYVFSKTFEKAGGKTVIFTKFGQEYSFVVPTRKGEKGVMELDPDIAAAVDKLTEGSSYWVQKVGNKLSAVEPYTDPQVGKLIKIKDTEVDGHKVPSADVETDGGKTVTLLVPVKAVGKSFVTDTVVNSELHRVHLNTMVEFRTHEDGGNTWLREIMTAPKTTEKKPADAAKPEAAKKDAAAK